MVDIKKIVYYGNKTVPLEEANISIASSAVLYGLSVYTVFPISINNQGNLVAFRLKDHFQRLINSARIIGIDGFENNWDFEKFKSAVNETVTANNLSEDVFARATIHVDELLPGTRSRGLHTTISIFLYEAVSILPKDGARLKTSVWRRIPDYAIPSRAKVNGAYVNSVLAKQDAIDSGYDDCVFLDSHGHVCELSAANIFIVRDGNLITPSETNDLLEGINRRTIIQIAKDEGINVVERTVDLTELYIADEVFACGTSAYLTHITEVDARKVGTGHWPIADKLQKIHADVIRGNSQKYQDLVLQLG